MDFSKCHEGFVGVVIALGLCLYIGQGELVIVDGELFVGPEDDLAFGVCMQGDFDGALEEGGLGILFVAIGADVKRGTQDADVDGGCMDKEGVGFVAGDVEISFAGELYFAVGAVAVDFIGEAAVGV